MSGAAIEKKKSPDLYKRLLSENEGKTSESTKYIDNDIERTFPEHPFFNKMSLTALRNVLYAYSWYNPKVKNRKRKI